MTESHTSSAQSPTLLVFTRGPERERASRRLLPERLGRLERSLHEECLRSAIDAGHACGFRVLISSPGRPPAGTAVEHLPQSGDTFGERVRRAARRAREGGDGPLLIVATDVPDLAPALLREAAAILASDPRSVVVGPSPDGGFYLLGFNGSLDEALANVRWRSSQARASLVRELRAAGRPVRLMSSLVDLDRRADLERWVARGAHLSALWRRLRDHLAELLRELRRPGPVVPALAPAAPRHLPWRGRAPPPAPLA